jgi:heme-degrading monooxygenase HmoA
MYATIRRYSTKTGANKDTIDSFKRRVEEKFIPTLTEIRGFHTYGVVNVGNNELLSISIFEDREGATQSTRKAAEFVQKDPLKDQLSKPEVLEGELLVFKEAPVGVR